MKRGMTAQSVASITVSAVWPVAPIEAIRPPLTRTSPRTMESRASIVTTVPLRMRIDDIKRIFAQRRKDAKVFLLDLCVFAPLREIKDLLRSGLHICRCRLFTNRKAQLHFHVPLDFAEHLGIVSQRLLRVLASLAQPLAFVREPRATFLNRPLHRGEIQQVAFA